MASVACPECQTINEVDFGLTPCVQCGRMLLPDELSESNPAPFSSEQDEVETVADETSSEESIDAEPVSQESPPTFETLEKEISELVQDESLSSLPFCFEVEVQDLFEPSKQKFIFELIDDPQFHISRDLQVHYDPALGQVTLQKLNTFQASRIVHACLRANLLVHWKQIAV